MIEISKYVELSAQVKNELSSYINDEFGHIQIVNETEWATPNWTIILYQEKQIATFYNIVETTINIDTKKYKVGGINNVITPKKFRGNGFASKALREAEHLIFDVLDCNIGLLLCADNLIPFYKKLNWYTVDCKVYFEQSTGKRLWNVNAMLLSQQENMYPHIIDLEGLPW